MLSENLFYYVIYYFYRKKNLNKSWIRKIEGSAFQLFN